MQQLRHISLLGALLATVSAGALAAPSLIAIGSLPGTSVDLSTETAGLLESGVAGNLLGVGSAIAYAGGTTFIAAPDRGPNAALYAASVDNTTSYITRFETFSLILTPNGGPGLPYLLAPTLTGTTLLHSANALVYGSGGLALDAGNALPASLGGGNTLPSGAPALNATNNTNYFVGRSDNFHTTESSTNPTNARFDPEGLRVSNDGKTVFISDEYGPYVRQFDRATGQLVKTFTLPDKFAVTNLSPVGASEVSGNTSGRQANRGMEGLAISPDGKKLVGIMQSPLIQDGALNSSNQRRGIHNLLVEIDISTGATKEYVYQMEDRGNGVNEILAINDHEYLVIERDGNGGTSAVIKRVYAIDTTGATDVSAFGSVTDNTQSGFPKPLKSGITAISTSNGKKTLFLDMLDPSFGLAGSTFPEKIEGIAFGYDVMLNGSLKHTLFVTNDNDFLAENPNNFYVFAFDDTDIENFQRQQIPEPATLRLVGLGLAGLLALRRRRG